ncbi:carbohydrate ABC transporter permease [Kribbella sp. NPDC005582]|uniref:carbohydrate ABC transporter permease n=1 Tax=Kribbella sp. NPDC005582 TaxID=3156893 RepID=UPI0033BD5948
MAFRSVRFLVFAVAIVLVVLPFVSVVSTSLSDQETLNRAGGFVLWTNSPTLDSYRQVFDGGIVTRALLVSATVTAVGTAISVSATIGLAFGLSRPKSPGSKPILMMVLFTLLFSPGLIPSYLMVKQLGLIDSYWALILPVAVNAFNVIVVRSFFMDLPQELIDSARIDGATEWKILTRITLPLSRAAIAVVSLFYGVGYWNAFFNAMLYLNDAAKWPLQLVLRQYAINGNAFDPAGSQGFVPPPQQAMQMAVLVVSIVPVIVVYPFLQKHFAKGMLTGAVKG